MSFLRATQSDTIKALEDEYGTDARDEIFRALRDELRATPLWMIIQHGLKVRRQEFKLYGPRPRSSESFANVLHKENRLYLMGGEHELTIGAGKCPDFVFFLNGLPIITMELKHEKNQNVHHAVAQYAKRNHSDRIF